MRMRFAAGLCGIGLLTATALGGPLPPFESVESLAKKGEIFVVGEVVKVETVGKDQTSQWGIPVLRQRATVHVFRGIKADATAAGLNEVVIDYLGRENPVVIIDGQAMLPELEPGRILVLALKHGALSAEGIQRWALVAQEGYGLYLWGIKEGLGGNADSALDFLCREVAAGMVKGDAEDMSRAITAPIADSGDLNAVMKLMEGQITDRQRWLDIAAVAYMLGVGGADDQRWPVSKILREGVDTKESWRGTRYFGLALEHLKGEGLEQELLAQLVEDQKVTSQRATEAILANGAQAELIMQLEREALEKDRAGAIEVSVNLLGKEGYSALLKPVIAAARRRVASAETGTAFVATGDFSQAVGVLLKQGSEEDFAYLLGQMKGWKPDRGVAFETLMWSAAQATAVRGLEVYRRCLDMKGPAPSAGPSATGIRLCDVAGECVQRISGRDFGLKSGDPLAQRDEALGRIREWLSNQG
jgi:hypothetical protein